MTCCAGRDDKYTTPVAGTCPVCGEDVDEYGDALDQCQHSPCTCEKCGHRPCDGGC